MSERRFDSRTFLFQCAFKALIDNGIEDPDVALFLGVFENDAKKVEAALKGGANPNVTDTDLVRRHFDVLIKPPVSERLTLCVVGVLMSPSDASESPKQAETA